VRVAAGAFGPTQPRRDLFLSPDHAVFAEGVLIPVKHLINDTAIAQVEVPEVIYYHVELAEHAVLIAEGLPAESYLDTGDRCNFENGGGAMALHPRFSVRTWEGKGCAPLVVTGPAVEIVRRRLEQRACIKDNEMMATPSNRATSRVSEAMG
jgi:collagen type I alpha